MDLITYFFGSLYIISALFRFSHSYSKMLVYKYKDIHKSNIEKVDEIIYSTIHSILIICMTSYSLEDNIFALDFEKSNNYNSTSVPYTTEATKLTLIFSLSYFTLDLVKCILRMNSIFILHHLCAINLLLFSAFSLDNKAYEGSFVMAYLLLLECNTPIMNLGTLLKLCKFDYNIYGTVWVLHLISYVLCRLIMIPYISYYYFLHNKISYYQLPNLLIIYGGSTYWAYKQMMGIKKHLIKN
jgi:hypothetical protein